MDKIILTNNQYQEYQDTEACFGSQEDGMSFDPSIPECKNCPDKELCEQLFNADSTVKIVNASTDDVAEVFDSPEETEETLVETEEKSVEPPVESKFEYTRESLTESLVMLGKKEGVTFTTTEMKARTKIFDKNVQVFTITNKTLRVVGKDGKALGLKSKDFVEKTSGIVIELDNTQAIKNVIMNYYNKNNTEETVEFTDELNLEQFAEVIKEEMGKVQPISVANPVGDNVDFTPSLVTNNLQAYDTKPEFDRRLIGGVAIKMYSDDTVEISTTIAKGRFEIEKIVEKMKELLESF